MSRLSSALDAALCAIRGEIDINAVMPALNEWQLARVVALAPDANPHIRAIAALCCGLPSLLSRRDIDAPDLNIAVQRMIGTPRGYSALWVWECIAPARWGAACIHAIRDAVNSRVCDPGVAAALIGPCDESAQFLLTCPSQMAFAIRRWGRLVPDDPTAWMHALSPEEQNRLITEVQSSPYLVATCLPWLPEDVARNASLSPNILNDGIEAFASASPTARARLADVVQRLVTESHASHLESLTRLACAMTTNDVWQRVQTLVQERPDDAYHVVVAAPWIAIPTHIRNAILDHADRSTVCAAIAAACGRRDTAALTVTQESAAAFFGALDPSVWSTLSGADQKRWLQALHHDVAFLAVRAAGLRPEVWAHMPINDPIIREARRHASHDDVVRWHLFPCALRSVPPLIAHDLIAAMLSSPSDSRSFFVIASGDCNPSIGDLVRTTLRTWNDLACAIALYRSATTAERVQDVCMTIQTILHGRQWKDVNPIVALLDAHARSMLRLDVDNAVAHLAHPTQRVALRRVCHRLMTLPPAIAISVSVLIERWRTKRDAVHETAHAIALALHEHGTIFLDFVDALDASDLRHALLPSLHDQQQQEAVRTLAQDDPPMAHLLAHALHNRRWDEAIQIMLRLPAHHRTAATPAVESLVARLAHPNQRDTLRHALLRLTSLSPEVDVAGRVMLGRLATAPAGDRRDAAIAVAHALREHGDLFLSITDALDDGDLRTEMLPLPDDPFLRNALRGFAQENPPIAQRLAYAFHARRWRHALREISSSTMHAPVPIWDAIIRMAMQSSPDELPESITEALATHTEVLRMLWNSLPQHARQSLFAHPTVAFALADLGDATLSLSQKRRDVCRW